MSNDIYAYLDASGTLKERLTAPQRTGASGAYAYAYLDGIEDIEPAYISYAYVNIDDTGVVVEGNTDESLMTDGFTETLSLPANVSSLDLAYFRQGTEYPFIPIPIPAEVLSVSGTWALSVRIAYGENSEERIISLGAIPFTVENTYAYVANDVTSDEYNYLLSQIAKWEQGIDSAQRTADNALEQAQTNAEAIEENSTAIANHTEAIAQNAADIANLSDSLDYALEDIEYLLSVVIIATAAEVEELLNAE